MSGLVSEWSYRVPTGIPDPKDSGHVEVLRSLLQEKKYPRRFIEALLDRLIGEEEFAAIKKDTKNVATFKTKDARDAAIKAGTHGKADQDKVKKAKPEPKAAAEPKAADKSKQVDKEAIVKQALAQLEREKERVMAMLDDPDATSADLIRSLQAKQKSDEAFYLYTPLNRALQAKGFGKRIQGIDPDTGETITSSEKTLKRYTRELQSILQDVSTEDKDTFVAYLNDPESHVPLPENTTGNMIDSLQQAGIPREVAGRLLKHTTQDDQKKGVGMGEFMMAMIYKNIKNSEGAGDLAFVNSQTGQEEEFEIKGHNATLGIKPDASNWFQEDSLAKFGITVKRTIVKNKTGKDTLKTDLEYDGETYEKKPGEFVGLMVRQYNKLNDEQKMEFENNFKEMMVDNVFKHSKDKMDRQMIDEFFNDPELKPNFSNPTSVHNTIGLLNHVNYVAIHGFDKFLSHDMGDASNSFNEGNYVFLNGSPLEQARQLKKELENPDSPILFQSITTNLSRPRIGWYRNAIKRKTATVEQVLRMDLEEIDE